MFGKVLNIVLKKNVKFEGVGYKNVFQGYKNKGVIKIKKLLIFFLSQKYKKRYLFKGVQYKTKEEEIDFL